MRALIIPPSDTAKYPPGVRFVFLLMLSIWGLLIFAGEDGQSQNTFIFALTSILSLVLLIIGLLPWAKKRRPGALIPALVLFIAGIPFFDGMWLPAIFGLCSIMLLRTRYGPVAVDQRRPVGILGYILLGLTFLITPVLTIFSIILVEETRADEVLLLITPAWLLFSGIILKIAGSGEKNLAPIKPLLFSGELSVLFSFPLFAFLAVAENSRGDKEMFYAIAFGSSVIFSLCVLFRGLLGNWLCGLLFGKPEPKISMVDKENTGLPPLIATPVRKPAMFLSNYGGLVVMGGFAVLGLIGFLIGGLFAHNSLQGGLTGMAGAIWAPFALVLSPLSLIGGIFALCWAIQHTRRYWYGWVGLIVLALASPFLLVLGKSITEYIFAKPDPVALVAEEEEEGEDEGSTEDSDGDGFYDSEEKLTGHDPNDPDSKPTQEEVDAALEAAGG